MYLSEQMFAQKFFNRIRIPLFDAHFLHFCAFRVQEFDGRMLSGYVFDCQFGKGFRSVAFHECCRMRQNKTNTRLLATIFQTTG